MLTKDMSVRQAMDLAESDRIHEGAELHDLPMCRAMIVMHDEIERLHAWILWYQELLSVATGKFADIMMGARLEDAEVTKEHSR